MKKEIAISSLLLVLALNGCQQHSTPVKNLAHRDSIIYTIKFRDTIIYRYDTIRIKHFVHTDTVWASPHIAAPAITSVKKRKVINPSNFGIGPSIGAYYSPFNGFDINIGFGVQYYFISIPTIRKPHLGHRHNLK